MKTSHFSENFDLCHPQLGSEQTKNNLPTNTNFSSDNTAKHESLATFGSSAVNYSTPSTSSSVANAATYGSSSSDQQTSKYERNANELLIRSQQRQQQQQQQQEQNKKRKRETGEYFVIIKITTYCEPQTRPACFPSNTLNLWPSILSSLKC